MRFAGQVTPIEAAEISKVIAGYVKAVEIAAITDRKVDMEKMTDEEFTALQSAGRQSTTGGLHCRCRAGCPAIRRVTPKGTVSGKGFGERHAAAAANKIRIEEYGRPFQPASP